ncbi:Peroxidase 24 [Vigna angularis]|uniref:peroxidase n=1 Tax=Phaseolus angularis TaxID=3914 RepID=A0A8T0L8P4_PHAAN|nr:Peroxidase 24 [Vigna angularis]
MKTRAFVVACLALFCILGVCQGGDLRKKFYKLTCSQAEDIVRTKIQEHVSARPELPAKLIRLHFHDCFVRGCDGSVLLDSTASNTAEKDSIPNLSLSGFDVIDDIKASLEEKCPGTVSCADILALAARDAVSVQFNKPMWEVLTGRRDGRVSISGEALANLPAPFFNITQLRQSFESKKLTVHDLVVLSEIRFSACLTQPHRKIPGSNAVVALNFNCFDHGRALIRQFGWLEECLVGDDKGVCQGGDLRKKFYKLTCSQAEDIVRTKIQEHVSARPELPAKLIRLHFHDCFVRGCDGSVLLDSTASNTAEKDSIPNLSLSGFDVIDDIKASLEEKCPGTVSCADILALAARDAVSVQFNKPMWEVLTGRRDGRVSISGEALANLPAPFFNITQLRQSFESKKLTVHDLVVLSGTFSVQSCVKCT